MTKNGPKNDQKRLKNYQKLNKNGPKNVQKVDQKNTNK